MPNPEKQSHEITHCQTGAAEANPTEMNRHVVAPICFVDIAPSSHLYRFTDFGDTMPSRSRLSARQKPANRATADAPTNAAVIAMPAATFSAAGITAELAGPDAPLTSSRTSAITSTGDGAVTRTSRGTRFRTPRITRRRSTNRNGTIVAVIIRQFVLLVNRRVTPRLILRVICRLNPRLNS